MHVKKPVLAVGFLAAVLLLAALVFLLLSSAQMREQAQARQRAIDDLFQSNFGLLASSLNVGHTDAQDMAALERERAEYAYMLMNLLSNTSYTEDVKLRDIVMELYRTMGARAIQENDLDSASIKSLMKLSLCLDDPETVDAAWDALFTK